MDSAGERGGNDHDLPRPQSAARRRPLRTYGRRAQLLSDRDSEPPRKKRAIEETSCLENNNDSGEARTQSCPPSSPQLPRLPAAAPALPVKRGSILAFFKPIPVSSSSSALQSQLISDATRVESVPSSPPSSPPPLPRPAKKRRRLTTRITLVEEEREAGNEAGHEPAKKEGPAEEYDVVEQTTADYGHTSALHELRSNLLNSAIPADRQTAEAGFQVKHAAKRRPRKATVQTTLNLSLADEPGFTICKECEMLYNPLNEKDRKDHTRRHAAAMRRKGEVSV